MVYYNIFWRNMNASRINHSFFIDTHQLCSRHKLINLCIFPFDFWVNLQIYQFSPYALNIKSLRNNFSSKTLRNMQFFVISQQSDFIIFSQKLMIIKSRIFLSWNHSRTRLILFSLIQIPLLQLMVVK